MDTRDLWAGVVIGAFGFAAIAVGYSLRSPAELRALDRDAAALVACEARAAACGAERAVCVAANRTGAEAVHRVIATARDCTELRDTLLKLRITEGP
jgi:hypothetical protein